MRLRSLIVLALLATSCTSQRLIRRVQKYRAAAARGDAAAEQKYLAPGARMFFNEKKGEGEPLGAGKGSWAHWDEYYRSRTEFTDWRVVDGAVTAVVHEINDFYRLLEWEPQPYRLTWWLDGEGRIAEVLLTPIPAGPVKSRMNEFKEWAAQHRPDELAYLMPKGRIDPTGDRAERFAAILREWRAQSVPAHRP